MSACKGKLVMADGSQQQASTEYRPIADRILLMFKEVFQKIAPISYFVAQRNQPRLKSVQIKS